ncbi:MAG: hypothetical protein EBS84_21990 [Proteobacteria bacterium]|nr:hypothetical protein [Pseudomonadota bacterium]
MAADDDFPENHITGGAGEQSTDVMYSIQSASYPYAVVRINAVDFVQMLCRKIEQDMSVRVLDSSKYSYAQLYEFKQLLLLDVFFRDQYANLQELVRVLSRSGEREVTREPEMYFRSSRPYIRLHLKGEHESVEKQLVLKQTILLEDDVTVEYYVCTDSVVYWRAKSFDDE